VRALAGIGDVRGLALLEDALATDVGPSVRRAAARGLGQLHLADLSADQRASLRDRCLQALEAAIADGEWVVRYAVAAGLEALALSSGNENPEACSRARTALQRLAAADGTSNPDAAPVVQLRARLALARLSPP
jgi:phycocyanobilin lyase beta subunit